MSSDISIDALSAPGAAPDITMLDSAERLPWECHRFLMSDYLVAAGEKVVHLVAAETEQTHSLNPVVRLRGGMLVYDGETQGELEL